MYYDKAGKVRAVGAEASVEGIYEMAEEEGWIKAEWWKLHLRSKFGAGKQLSDSIPPLPPNKTVTAVFADFLSYLLECSASYIKTTLPSGPQIWKSLSSSGDIDFVLTHPNGWEGLEQTQMRKAAVLAGLITDDAKGHARLMFVTEGEASLHFAIWSGLPEGVMKKGEGVVIVDAGGGTVDISSYRRNNQAAFEELAPPQSYFHGSVFVSIHADAFIQNYLQESTFSPDADAIVQAFDKTTKLRFKSADEVQYVKFGSTRDNDPEFNIRFGQFKLPGSDVATFFQPSIDCIVNAVLDQQKATKATKPISHVVLVGGFAQSPWLSSRVTSALDSSSLAVFVPEGHVNKAVSHGAISFYLHHHVLSRVAKFTYGTMLEVPFNPADADHQKRMEKVYTTPSGEKRVPRGFDVILPKGTQVSESNVTFRKSYTWISDSKQAFKFMDSIWCYRGALENPKWKDEDTENYTKVCYIEVDLSHLRPEKQRNSDKKKYYTIEYSIILLFGMTEMKAQVGWMEKGVEKRSPARIIYDPDTKDV
ncbi:hypothetical protein GALMADRAFT_255879 [Galerina marginata CBS 339.88]|uniref:Uncharacterized protein n=1 Tax=Galerina marginata (strain CBS 339.88) TaxID=685588 RepID=A0A067SNW4_GALM3|nr:hypothetical protein GALMADRAFT_255879 [Galerina marginata CBS 339.88]